MLPKSALKSENSQERKLSLKWADSMQSVSNRKENIVVTAKGSKKISSKNKNEEEGGSIFSLVPSSNNLGHMRIFDTDKPPVDIRDLAIIPAPSRQMPNETIIPNFIHPLSEISSNLETKTFPTTSTSFSSSHLPQPSSTVDTDSSSSPPARRNIRPPIGSLILPRTSHLMGINNTNLASPPPTPTKIRVIRVFSQSGPKLNDNKENSITDTMNTTSIKKLPLDGDIRTTYPFSGNPSIRNTTTSTTITNSTKNNRSKKLASDTNNFPTANNNDGTGTNEIIVSKSRSTKGDKLSKSIRSSSTAPITIPSLALEPMPLPLNYRRYGSQNTNNNSLPHSTTTSMVKDDFTFSPLSSHSSGPNDPAVVNKILSTVTVNNSLPLSSSVIISSPTTTMTVLPASTTTTITRSRLKSTRFRKNDASIARNKSPVPQYVTNEELVNVLAMVKNQQEVTNELHTVVVPPMMTPSNTPNTMMEEEIIDVPTTTKTGTKRRSRSRSVSHTVIPTIHDEINPESSVTTSISSTMSIVTTPSQPSTENNSTVPPPVLPMNDTATMVTVGTRVSTWATKRKIQPPSTATAAVTTATVTENVDIIPSTRNVSFDVQDMDIDTVPSLSSLSLPATQFTPPNPVTATTKRSTLAVTPAQSTSSSTAGRIDPTILSIAALAIANAVADITQKTQAMRINTITPAKPLVPLSSPTASPSHSPTYGKNGTSSTTSSHGSYSAEWKAILNDSSMVMDTSTTDTDTTMNTTGSKRIGPVLWHRLQPVSLSPILLSDKNPSHPNNSTDNSQLFIAPLKINLTPDGEMSTDSVESVPSKYNIEPTVPEATNIPIPATIVASTTTAATHEPSFIAPPVPVLPPPATVSRTETVVPHEPSPPIFDQPFSTLSPIPILESVMTSKGTYVPSTLIIQPSTVSVSSTGNGMLPPTFYTVIPSVTLHAPPPPPQSSVPLPPVASTTSSTLMFDMGVSTLDFSFLRNEAKSQSKTVPPSIPFPSTIVPPLAVTTPSNGSLGNPVANSTVYRSYEVSKVAKKNTDTMDTGGDYPEEAEKFRVPSPTFDSEYNDSTTSSSSTGNRDEQQQEISYTVPDHNDNLSSASGTSGSTHGNDNTETLHLSNNKDDDKMTVSSSSSVLEENRTTIITPDSPDTVMDTNEPEDDAVPLPSVSLPVPLSVDESEISTGENSVPLLPSDVSNFAMHYYQPHQDDYTNKLILEDITSVPSDDDDASWCARQHLLRVSLFPPLHETDFVSSLLTLSAGPGTATALGYRPSKQEMFMINQTFNNPAYNDNHNDNVRYDQEPLTLYYHGRKCEKDYPPSCLTTLSTTTKTIVLPTKDDDESIPFIDKFLTAWLNHPEPSSSSSIVAKRNVSITKPKRTTVTVQRKKIVPQSGLTIRPLFQASTVTTTTSSPSPSSSGTPESIDINVDPNPQEFSFISTDSGSKQSNETWLPASTTTKSLKSSTTTSSSSFSSSSSSRTSSVSLPRMVPSLSSVSKGGNDDDDDGFRRRKVGKQGKYKVKSSRGRSTATTTTAKRNHHYRQATTSSVTKKNPYRTIRKVRISNTVTIQPIASSSSRLTGGSTNSYRRPFAGVFDSPPPIRKAKSTT